MKKQLKIITALALTASLTATTLNSASASTQKVMWGKTELKVGQVGKITVLKDTPLYRIVDSKTISSTRTLKKGEEFRAYSYKNQSGGLYGVGGGMFIQKDPKIKYETPSKSKLALLKNGVPTASLSGKEFTHEEVMEKLNKVVPEKFDVEYSENSYLVKDMDTVVFGLYFFSDKEVKAETYVNYKPISNNMLGFSKWNFDNKNYKSYLSIMHELLKELGIENNKEDLSIKLDSVNKGKESNLKLGKANVISVSGSILVRWDN